MNYVLCIDEHCRLSYNIFVWKLEKNRETTDEYFILFDPEK